MTKELANEILAVWAEGQRLLKRQWELMEKIEKEDPMIVLWEQAVNMAAKFQVKEISHVNN